MKENGQSSLEELAALFEMEATEWQDSGESEYARQSMITAALVREHSIAMKALGDCYMMACRRAREGCAPQNQDWHHVKRFCEATGLRPQILRWSLPTEITGG